jgi:hypothetical protein
MGCVTFCSACAYKRAAPLEFVTDGDLVQDGHDGAATQTFILRDAAAKLKRSGEATSNVEAAKISR